MGIETILTVGISFALSAAASVYALMVAGKQKKNEMSPQTLDSFGVTQAKEGSVVPLIYGRCRVPGNIVYYGDLYSEEIYAEIDDGGGGKGFMGKGGDQVTGYKYYLDVWQTVGIGKLSLIDTYVNDDHVSPEAAVTLWNDGTTTTAPTAYVGSEANALLGAVHVFYHRLYLGDNVTQVPTIHFVVEKTLSTGLSDENMSNGNNPAAIIYDLLVMSGIQPSKIDYASFEVAAQYWSARGYGLNLVFSEQKSLYDAINTVLQQVDGSFFVNANGRYAIRAYDPDQATTKEIDTDDLYEFSLQRPAYSQLPNYLRATYTDEDQDYSERIAGPLVSDAGLQAAERLIEKSFELKGFRDLDTACARLAEIMKYTSYPVAKVEFATNFKFATLVPGDVVEITNEDMGIAGAKFRIDSVDFPTIDSLLLKFRATQVAEAIFDTNYAVIGGSEYAREPATPSDYPRYRSEIILPYNSRTLTIPHRLFLVERENDYENGYLVQARAGQAPDAPYDPGSDADNGYYNLGVLRSFAKLVNVCVPIDYLDDPTTYPLYPLIFDHTYDLDDGEEGITFYTYQNHLDLTQWPDLERTELFTTNRFLFVSTLYSDGGSEKAMWTHEYSELLAFQRIDPIEGPETGPYSGDDYRFYRITGYLRAALYTQKQNHQYRDQSGTPRFPCESWLFSVADNYLQESRCGNYRVILPRSMGLQADAADNHPFYPPAATFAVTQKNVFSPGNICGPGRIHAVRSGSNIDVTYYPATYTLPGAGLGNPDEVTDSETFDYLGTLYFEHGATVVSMNSPETTYNFSDAAEVTLAVYVTLPGRAGNAVYGELVIGTDDGEYVAYTAKVS